VVDGNPLVSMRDLRNVVAVIKDGKVYKEKGVPVEPAAATRTTSSRGK
jgi:hypothetical protein